MASATSIAEFKWSGADDWDEDVEEIDSYINIQSSSHNQIKDKSKNNEPLHEWICIHCNYSNTRLSAIQNDCKCINCNLELPVNDILQNQNEITEKEIHIENESANVQYEHEKIQSNLNEINLKNPSPVLPYRWEYKESDWVPLSYEQCQQVEQDLIIQQKQKTTIDSKTEAHKYGQNYKLVKDKVKLRELRRSETFTGKVLNINSHYSRGFVESNFPNNQNKGIRFYFSDCQFNAKSLNKFDTVEYQIKYDQNKSEFAAYNVKISKQQSQKPPQKPFPSNNKNKQSVHSKSHIGNMAKQYNSSKNRHYKSFNEHKMKNVPKPLWHPQYMSIILNGYFTKHHNNEGFIQRKKGSKCNEKESDKISFYFKHCTKKVWNTYQKKQTPIFVKFKIGYGQKHKLLAYDVDFDYEKPKRVIKNRGEVTQLPKGNHMKNKSGWIYCEEENWYYPFDNMSNIHYNIGNTVYFNTYIQNGMNWANNINISKKYDQAVWVNIYNGQSKIIHNNSQGDKGKPLYIQDAPIDLTEDLLTEFKQFTDSNGYCNVIKIGEEMLKYLNAFVNTQGGSIYFGIDDNGIIRGEEFVDDEAQDNIQKYIDNRLRQWTPKDDYLVLKAGVKVDFIQVIRRRDDRNCYLLPDVMVIRASIGAIRSQNGQRFTNQDNKSWTKNLASVARVNSDINLFGKNKIDYNMLKSKWNDISGNSKKRSRPKDLEHSDCPENPKKKRKMNKKKSDKRNSNNKKSKKRNSNNHNKNNHNKNFKFVWKKK